MKKSSTLIAHAIDLAGQLRANAELSTVDVRAQRGHLYVYPDTTEDWAVARLTPLGAAGYGLSFHHHTGRWEPMPYSGSLGELAQVIVEQLSPFLIDFQR
jgi:hypothetical protein